jgi:hypothetical protein
VAAVGFAAADLWRWTAVFWRSNGGFWRSNGGQMAVFGEFLAVKWRVLAARLCPFSLILLRYHVKVWLEREFSTRETPHQ